MLFSLKGDQQVVVRFVERVGLADEFRGVEPIEGEGGVCLWSHLEEFIFRIDCLNEFVTYGSVQVGGPALVLVTGIGSYDK